MLDQVLYSALTILGIGIIIFVHELGHFLAARAVGIRVEAFSIGFGPRLFGFRRGGTDYKICILPLGGFVKMAGEDPTQPTTGAADEFASKTVGQRAIVVSAGVAMNMIFAVIAIPIVFSMGIEYSSPAVGWVAAGGGAQRAGIWPGDVIKKINGRPVMGFEDIRLDIALSGGPVDLEIERGGQSFDTLVEPADAGGFLQIGVAPTFDKVSIAKEAFEEGEPGSPESQRAKALKAAGLGPKDRIVSLNGLPLRYSGGWYDEVLAGTVTLRAKKEGGKLVSVSLPPIYKEGKKEAKKRVGIVAVSDSVLAVPKGSPAAKLGLRKGDLIQSIQGRPLATWPSLAHALGSGKDPRREEGETILFPHQLRLKLLRGSESLEVSTVLKDRDELIQLYWSLVVKPQSTIVRVQADFPAAAAGLLDGDRIVAVDGTPTHAFSEVVETISKHKDADGAVALKIDRGGETLQFQVVRSSRYNIACPLLLDPATHKVTYPFPESLEVGVVQTGRMTRRIFQTLRSLFRGTVSTKNISGPIGIFTQAKKTMRRGTSYGLLFMAFVSINLAILNILPIPVLDGGWLVFLLIEKIKGSPPSQKAMAAAQWAGLVLILALAVFATRNDILRLF